MNNDELKKKIENLLHKEIEYVVVCGSSIKNVCIEHIADALISAGIGDVKEAEHRAEVAERAARDLIAYYCSYTIQSDIDSGLRVALQQAEKELEGEKPIKTSDLSQCQSCAYHYTYEGQDMCRQVGDDFYLQWKMEDCPKYSFIGDVLCSEPVYQLKHELRSKIEYIHEQDEVIKEYKHRAARAERALQIADELGELCGRKEDYVQQAEKELQEEKKSD